MDWKSGSHDFQIKAIAGQQNLTTMLIRPSNLVLLVKNTTQLKEEIKSQPAAHLHLFHPFDLFVTTYSRNSSSPFEPRSKFPSLPTPSI
jgi:hypothetical protein